MTKLFVASVLKRFVIICAVLALGTLSAGAQEWVTFLECEIKCDHKDTLTIQTNGNWTYTSEGGQMPFGLCGGWTVQGANYQCMERFADFPSAASLGRSLTNWSVEVIEGTAPRCPAVNAGSNPTATLSVIEHTNSFLRISMRDDGACGSNGRVDFKIRVRYFKPVAPTIVVQPQSIRADAASRAQLEVAGAGGNLSYQWRQNGTNISGATSPVLTIASLKRRDAGNYAVVISNPAGSVASRTVQLEVVPPQVTLHARPALPQVIELSWNTIPGMTYRLLQASSLKPPIQFSTVGSQFVAAGSEIKQLQVTSPSGGAYYLVEVDF